MKKGICHAEPFGVMLIPQSREKHPFHFAQGKLREASL
jgi:hypothetical protein